MQKALAQKNLPLNWTDYLLHNKNSHCDHQQIKARKGSLKRLKLCSIL
jgi:hypothetical protein